MKYNFGGYATKNNIRCADGRVIRQDAFKDCDGIKVPLVWQHQRNSPDNVLGHALLENRKDGVYAYCLFNNTDQAQIAKELVEHGDLSSLSIHANQLKQQGNNVTHGMIREVSLVIAGANPGAVIDNLGFEHSDRGWVEDPEEAYISWMEELDHSVDFEASPNQNDTNDNDLEHAEDDSDDTKETGESVKAIFDAMTDKQKKVVYAMVGAALAEGDDDEEEGDDAEHSEDYYDDEEGGDDMKHNIFEKGGKQDNSLTHDEMVAIFDDARRSQTHSLKETMLEHGIENLEILFPEAQAISKTPDLITRDMEWVPKVWNATKKTPFSRIKSMTANITEDEARAKGYIKGKKKSEETFALLKRSTTPQTVYKKQGLDRDDIIDISDFDVVAWMKAEMRMMLNEELARAILVGDGRSVSSDDKINEQNIRPVYTDDDLYTIKYNVNLAGITDTTERANAIIDAANISRIQYKGSGSPVFYTDSYTLTNLLLAKDKLGYRLYKSVSELATAMRVREIVEVPVMENLTRTFTSEGGTSKTMKLIGLIVNLSDYAVGADRGGAVSMFDDFDIDYNRYKYLIETRCSGALIKPYSAIVLETEVVEAAG